MNKFFAIISFFVSSVAILCGAEQYNEVEVVASTIYHEARGEGIVGMDAVASVIYNRAHQPRWKKLGLAGVCLQKKQFSCHNKGFLSAKPKTVADKKAYKYCKELANKMINGSFKSTVGNANHYCTLKCNVYWKSQLKNTIVVKNHIFGIM